MRLGLAGLVALLLFVAPAQAAPRLRLTAPSKATAGTRLSVKLTGPKTGKVAVYVLTHTKVGRKDKPTARGSLKRGKLTLKLKLPAKVRTYRLIACIGKRCTGARPLKVVAVAGSGAGRRAGRSVRPRSWSRPPLLPGRRRTRWHWR